MRIVHRFMVNLFPKLRAVCVWPFEAEHGCNLSMNMLIAYGLHSYQWRVAEQVPILTYLMYESSVARVLINRSRGLASRVTWSLSGCTRLSHQSRSRNIAVYELNITYIAVGSSHGQLVDSLLESKPIDADRLVDRAVEVSDRAISF